MLYGLQFTFILHPWPLSLRKWRERKKGRGLFLYLLGTPVQVNVVYELFLNLKKLVKSGQLF